MALNEETVLRFNQLFSDTIGDNKSNECKNSYKKKSLLLKKSMYLQRYP